MTSCDHEQILKLTIRLYSNSGYSFINVILVYTKILEIMNLKIEMTLKGHSRSSIVYIEHIHVLTVVYIKPCYLSILYCVEIIGL